jgi:hypothetical protein
LANFDRGHQDTVRWAPNHFPFIQNDCRPTRARLTLIERSGSGEGTSDRSDDDANILPRAPATSPYLHRQSDSAVARNRARECANPFGHGDERQPHTLSELKDVLIECVCPSRVDQPKGVHFLGPLPTVNVNHHLRTAQQLIPEASG